MRFNQRSSARHPRGGRLQIGIGGRLGSEQVADFKSESVAGFKSEWVADFPRNPHQTGRLSLFHVLEQMQSKVFPIPLSLTLVGIFVKEAVDPDEHSLHVKVGLDDTTLLNSPVAL